ncbi:sulfotransferase [Pelagibius sp.]|uniref:sulfotransferase family protein n=1 Tax=Pelagibius sp. TaxID=1931238 RepID=UPI00261D233A|nr:sulfotransferase [Pelagibius sp.]
MSAASTISGTIILGHPRSGTTLLRRLLDAHPEIAAPPETHLFGAAARFLAADVTAEGTDMGVLSGLEYLGFEESETLDRLRALCFGFLDDFARQSGKRFWAEKTAFDAFQIPMIERLCGDRVRYLGILRHPFSVAVSCREFCDAMGSYPQVLHHYVRRWPQPIEAFLHSWIDVSEALVALGQRRPQQVLILRYEDLVDDLTGSLTDILGFMGADTDTGFAEGALARVGDLGFSDHKSYQSSSVHTNSRDRWRELPMPQVARLAPLAADWLERLGYPPLETGPAPDFQEARRRYLHSLGHHARSTRKA